MHAFLLFLLATSLTRVSYLSPTIKKVAPISLITMLDAHPGSSAQKRTMQDFCRRCKKNDPFFCVTTDGSNTICLRGGGLPSRKLSKNEAASAKRASKAPTQQSAEGPNSQVMHIRMHVLIDTLLVTFANAVRVLHAYVFFCVVCDHSSLINVGK